MRKLECSKQAYVGIHRTCGSILLVSRVAVMINRDSCWGHLYCVAGGEILQDKVRKDWSVSLLLHLDTVEIRVW